MPAGVPNVNLIPGRRLISRRAIKRARLWLGVIPCSVGLLVAGYVVNRLSWETDPEPLRRAMDETAARIKEVEAKIARQGKELREMAAKLKANRAVGEQPDWSLLLDVLASRLGSEAMLRMCVLEPVAKGGSGKDADRRVGRPEELKLTMKGVAGMQSAVSRFVLELERSGAFDQVQLVETRREKDGAEGGSGEILFEVVCVLSDPGGSVK